MIKLARDCFPSLDPSDIASECERTNALGDMAWSMVAMKALDGQRFGPPLLLSCYADGTPTLPVDPILHVDWLSWRERSTQCDNRRPIEILIMSGRVSLNRLYSWDIVVTPNEPSN